MTRCRVCNCKLKSGDICPRCKHEQDWLNTPERFCKHCGDHIPGAAEDRYCPKCADEFKKPERPPAGNCEECGRRLTPSGHCYSCTTRKQMEAKKKERELLVMRKIRMRNEKCAVCGHQLTINGSCRSCMSRTMAEKRFGKIENPAPKTGAEKPSTILEPAADTIHASPPPTQVVKINELDVCRQAINKHGISRQLAKAAEEFSEAAAAISRFLAGEGEYTEIINEVADVEVMCVQMRMIYGTDSIEQVRAEKVARLHGRLKTEF